jgi:hypothetical protein
MQKSGAMQKSGTMQKSGAMQKSRGNAEIRSNAEIWSNAEVQGQCRNPEQCRNLEQCRSPGAIYQASQFVTQKKDQVLPRASARGIEEEKTTTGFSPNSETAINNCEKSSPVNQFTGR